MYESGYGLWADLSIGFHFVGFGNFTLGSDHTRSRDFQRGTLLVLRFALVLLVLLLPVLLLLLLLCVASRVGRVGVSPFAKTALTYKTAKTA